MAKRTAPYRRWRVDIFGHPKTGGMHLAAYGLMQYAGSQNILGVLRQSPRAIAKACDDMPVKLVIEMITELVTRSIAKWWPDLEVLWMIESLDEQSDGGLADTSAKRLLPTLPAEVQDAIRERYGDRVSEGVPIPPSDTHSDGGGGRASAPVNREQGTGNREPPCSPPTGDTPANEPPGTDSPAEARECSPPAVAAARSRRSPRRTPPDDLVVHVLAEMARACRELDPQNSGPRDVPGNRDLIAKLHAAQTPTAEQWTTVIRRQLASVRGDKAKHRWLSLSTLCVSANFARLLDAPGGSSTDRSKPWSVSDFDDLPGGPA